jgi:hypothetical protein
MSAPKGLGSWIVIIVLLSLLAATGIVVYRGLTVGDAAVPASGYVAMALGVIFSLTHVPAKWNPVRRREHASTLKSTAFPVHIGSLREPASPSDAI